MKTSTLTNSKVSRYLPIYLESLRTDSIPDFDLYRGSLSKSPSESQSPSELVLYRSASEPFTEKVRASLLENGVSVLYVPRSMQRYYQTYLETHMREILGDESVDAHTKANIAYDCSRYLIKDIMDKPTLGENIKRGQDMVEISVDQILCDETAFSNMLRVMSFDYSTYTHSINVCTFSVALARFSGIKDEEVLNKIGIGALLHDVGKTRVPEEILNKRDLLDEKEFELIKKHPQWGWDIIQQSDVIPEESYYPILQHHERYDGSGYPDKLKAEEIHDYSKIVAIADVFDAMTTQRVYRNAVDTFPALMVMYGDKDKFDEDLLELFTRLMGPCRLLEG